MEWINIQPSSCVLNKQSQCNHSMKYDATWKNSLTKSILKCLVIHFSQNLTTVPVSRGTRSGVRCSSAAEASFFFAFGLSGVVLTSPTCNRRASIYYTFRQLILVTFSSPEQLFSEQQSWSFTTSWLPSLLVCVVLNFATCKSGVSKNEVTVDPSIIINYKSHRQVNLIVSPFLY